MPNKIYTARETAITFADSAQTPSYTITLSALANGAGRISAQADRGAGSTASWYRWRATIQQATAGTVGNTFEIYVSTSDGTNPDGNEGVADAALSAENKLKNMRLIGIVIADLTTTNTNITASGDCWIPTRYFSVVVWNRLGVALKTDTAVHSVKLTPIPDEVQ